MAVNSVIPSRAPTGGKALRFGQPGAWRWGGPCRTRRRDPPPYWPPQRVTGASRPAPHDCFVRATGGARPLQLQEFLGRLAEHGPFRLHAGPQAKVDGHLLDEYFQAVEHRRPFLAGKV